MYVVNLINTFMSYIINGNPKTVFIHIPKTAGNAIITGLSKTNNISHIPNDRTVNSNYHSTLLDVEKFLSNLENQFIFTVVRNPWDRVSSWFFFRKNILRLSLKNFEKAVSKKKVINNKSKIQKEYELMCSSFDRWLLTYYEEPWDNTWFSLSHNQNHWLKGSRVSVDKIVKYETLKEDLKFLNIKLPFTNQSRKTVSTYRDLYTDNSKNLIYKIYQEDIEEFNYEF